MNISTFPKVAILTTAITLFLSGASSAQESAYADLDACTKNEQIKLTAKGAMTGAITGLGAALFSGKKDKAVQAAAVGAVVGGVAGFSIAYYNAVETCYKLNPSWIPESQLQRDPSKSYAQVVKENQYNTKEGIKVLAKNLDLPNSAKAGTSLDVTSSYDLMTPDGSETAVVVDRRLFAVANGKETAIPFPGKTTEERIVAVGRSKDTVKLKIPPDAKTGETYRLELGVRTGEKPPSVISKTITVS